VRDNTAFNSGKPHPRQQGQRNAAATRKRVGFGSSVPRPYEQACMS
jgi:hypothetical protein